MSSLVSLRSVLRLLQTPDVLRQGIKTGIRRRVGAHIDYHLRDGYSAPPVQVDIKITDACNLRCTMCAQWGKSGYNFTRPREEIRNILPLETYKKLADDICEFKPWIYIWGGEPFLYPHILSLLTYMKEKGLIVSVISNGTRTEKYVEPLVDIGCDVLIFSINGPRDTHDIVVGLGGAFDAAVSSIKSIQIEKARRDRIKPYIFLIAVVTGDNQHNLECVFDLGEELRVDGVLVNYGWFQTLESGHHYMAIMKEKLDTIPWSWRGWLWGVHEIDPNVLLESVKRIRAQEWGFPVKFFPALAYENILHYYREHANTFGHNKCMAPWVKAEIMPSGDVAMCGEYPDYVVGNITGDSLLDIWNSERARKFRSVLKDEGGLLPVCARCPGLMGW